MTRLADCGCGARIVWCRTPTDRAIALDADAHGNPIPHPEGTLVKLGNHQPPVVRYATTGDPQTPRYSPHTSSCALSTHTRAR